MLYLVVGAARVMEFRLVGSSTTLYAGVNGTLASATLVADGSGDPGVIEVRDTSGRVMTFFDFDGDAQGAQGQLWKVTDEDGNGGTAYAGLSSSMASALASFETDTGTKTARVTNIVDASDRKFTFAYTTVGGSPRLASVIAYIKTGGTWASSPTGVSEIGRVEYAYYSSDSSGVGKTGDLKFVTTTMPLSSGGSLVHKTYYRYETGSGQEHIIKYVVAPEGNRTYNGDLSVQSDSTVGEHASHKFTYNTSARTIATATFNGECGCGGSGANGTHSLSISTNGSFSGSLSDAVYDSSGDWTGAQWYKRVIVSTPDGHQYAIYLDEVGQQLGKVYADTSLSSPAALSITKILRDSSGRWEKMLTPASIASYTHTTGMVLGGTIESDTEGLVRQRTFPGSSNYQAGSAKSQVRDGTDTAIDVAQTTFDSGGVKSLTDGTDTVVLSRLLPATSVRYSGTTDTTSFSRSFYSSASSWAPKVTTTTLPSLSGGDISGPSSVTTKVWTDAKGRMLMSVVISRHPGDTSTNRTSKETWTLSQTGNWTGNTRDVDGDNSNEYSFGTNTFTDTNEWTSRTNSVGSYTEYMDYDDDGNMTSWGAREGDGQTYTYTYDAFGRLMKVHSTGAGSYDLANYRYNGLGFRIMWQYDADMSFTSLTDSERYFFMYDDRWRIVGTFRYDDDYARESFVYHAAGKAGGATHPILIA